MLNEARRASVRRGLLILAAVSLVWAFAIGSLGGFTLQIGRLRLLSSHEIHNPLILFAASFIGALVVSTPLERRRLLPTAWACVQPDVLHRVAAAPRWAAPFVASLLAVGTVVVGIERGAMVAGGADAYGYVSQADLWSQGRLHLDEPLLGRVQWPYKFKVLSPLGYRPNPGETAIVPTYPPGYPLQMSLAQRIGGREAAFYVVPVLGGVVVAATYALGATMTGPLVGLAAAGLMASSSVFFYQLIYPMSDVPVTAWWTLALVFALFQRPVTAWLAGSASAIAILTRPNLAPVAAVFVLFLLALALRERKIRGSYTSQLVWFTVGIVPGVFGLAAFQYQLYGSPFRSGHGDVSQFFAWAHIIPNLRRYPQWLLESNTPIVLLGAASPFVLPWLVRWGGLNAAKIPHAILLAAFIVAIYLSYVAYLVFDAWWYLRFLLPLMPPLFVLSAATLVAILGRASSGFRRSAVAAVVLAVAWHSFDFLRDRDLLGLGHYERKYREVGTYVATHLPEDAVVFAMQHSGSVRYYSGRPIVRYDLVPGPELGQALADLQRLGYHPYALLEEWEIPIFQQALSAVPALGPLDWPPIARHRARIGIYDMLGRNTVRTRAPDLID